MRLLVIAAGAVAGLAFWRRKTLKDDAIRAKDAGKNAATTVKDKVRRNSDDSTDESVEDLSSDSASDEEVTTSDNVPS